jgi:hypothetical protein
MMSSEGFSSSDQQKIHFPSAFPATATKLTHYHPTTLISNNKNLSHPVTVWKSVLVCRIWVRLNWTPLRKICLTYVPVSFYGIIMGIIESHPSESKHYTLFSSENNPTCWFHSLWPPPSFSLNWERQIRVNNDGSAYKAEVGPVLWQRTLPIE